MPPRKILIFQKEDEWSRYLLEAFEDTFSTPSVLSAPGEILTRTRKEKPDVIFTRVNFLTPPLIAALGVCRASSPDFRIFGLGNGIKGSRGFSFDGTFQEIPPSLFDFHRRLVEYLPLPDPLDILIVDDEPQIGAMFLEYFDRRTHPSFRLRMAANGVEAEKEIRKSFPHVMVLDIKMPQQDGRELYRSLKEKSLLPPTLVFFDAVSVDEVVEIRRLGNRAFVEKGSQTSSMPEMAALIKKIAFFG